MKKRALLASIAALLLVVGVAPAHASPQAPVASITLVLRPQTPGAPAQTYVAENVRVGPGAELHGACGPTCEDYAHPTVDIDLASGTISVMIPGSEHQFTDAELVVRTDVIAGFRGLGSARERSADTRRAEVTADGARMTWTSYTGFAPATVVFEIETTASSGPQAPPTSRPDPTEVEETDPPVEPAPDVDASAGTADAAPTSGSVGAEAAAPVVAEPTFTG